MSRDPFHDRPAEWKLYQPLVGKTMLELGNKKNGECIYKNFFESLGFAHTSVDLNGKDGALALDLQVPLKLGTFDMVANIGTTEHVDQQEGVWRNICEALHVGSVLISTTPLEGSWWWHGTWYPRHEFYIALAQQNGLYIERLYVEYEHPRRMLFTRMVRRALCPFSMPEGGMFLNRMRPR